MQTTSKALKNVTIPSPIYRELSVKSLKVETVKVLGIHGRRGSSSMVNNYSCCWIPLVATFIGYRCRNLVLTNPSQNLTIEPFPPNALVHMYSLDTRNDVQLKHLVF